MWRFLAPVVLASWAQAQEAGIQLVRLENARVVVELAPRLGGRLVHLGRPGGANVLAVSAATLALPESGLPRAAADGAFLPVNGSVVWFGPQSAWWTQQDVNPQRRAERAGWPPDPFLEYGEMRIAERSAAAVRLVGDPSPVTGLRLTSTVRLTADGAVVQEIEALNASDRTVAWDIWPNVRIRSDAQVFAPYDGGRLKVAFNTAAPTTEKPLPYHVDDGYFSFATEPPAADRATLHLGKAFLAPTDSRLFALTGTDLVVIAAETPPPGTVHPEHAPVEVFRCAGGPPERSLLELEFHSPFTVLAPGSSLRFALAWKLVPVTAAPAGQEVAIIRAHEADAHALRGLFARPSGEAE